MEEWPLQIFYIPGKEADDMEAGEQDSNRPLSSRSGESNERGMPRVESLGAIAYQTSGSALGVTELPSVPALEMAG